MGEDTDSSGDQADGDSVTGTKTQNHSIDPAELQRLRKKLRKGRGRELTHEERLDVAAVKLYFWEQKSQTKGAGRPPKIAVDREVKRALMRGGNTVSEAWSYFLSDGKVGGATAGGARGKKHERIRRTPNLLIELRDWLHDRECRRARTNVRDVALFLREKGHIEFDSANQKEFETARRTTHNFVNRIGLVRSPR